MDALWQRIRDGRHTAVVGARVPEPGAEVGVRLVRVSCDRRGGALAPLVDARAAVRRLLGEPADDGPVAAAVGAPRRRMLEEPDDPQLRVRLVAELNRLADAADRPTALVLDGIDRADEATLTVLREAVLQDGWLRLPLVFAFRAAPASAAGEALLAAVEDLEGAAAVLRVEAPAADVPAGPLPELPPEVRLVLRAATVVGPVFEAELVGLLLGMDELTALELFQGARDAGVPLEDRDDGILALPAATVAALEATLLPSLARAWHRRLAMLLGEAEAARGPEAALEALLAPEEAPPPEPERAGPASRPSTPGAVRRAALAEGAERRPDAHARAAHHLASAGDVDAAAARLLEAARQANLHGAFMEAVAYAQDAVRTAERLPRASQRRLLMARARAELGRARWLGASPERAYTLAEAREVLEEALGLLEDGDPPEIRAEVRALLASVLYDSGERQALERALEELTHATRLLEAAGRPVDGARLLNDQAAVWVRIGDTTRAHRLLMQSRHVFEKMAADDAVALVELAETDHLIARLPLHVAARPGREADAIDVGLQHARAAEGRYEELGDERELARVWETIGRLEALRGKTDVAIEWLRRAVPVHQELGDFIGLARTAEALARTLVSVGQPEDALVLLADSVALNEEKGSPVGLAYNRRTLEALVGRLTSRQERALGEAARAVAEQIGAAESRVGRTELPAS